MGIRPAPLGAPRAHRTCWQAAPPANSPARVSRVHSPHRTALLILRTDLHPPQPQPSAHPTPAPATISSGSAQRRAKQPNAGLRVSAAAERATGPRRLEPSGLRRGGRPGPREERAGGRHHVHPGANSAHTADQGRGRAQHGGAGRAEPTPPPRCPDVVTASSSLRDVRPRAPGAATHVPPRPRPEARGPLPPGRHCACAPGRRAAGACAVPSARRRRLSCARAACGPAAAARCGRAGL